MKKNSHKQNSWIHLKEDEIICFKCIRNYLATQTSH